LFTFLLLFLSPFSFGIKSSCYQILVWFRQIQEQNGEMGKKNSLRYTNGACRVLGTGQGEFFCLQHSWTGCFVERGGRADGRRGPVKMYDENRRRTWLRTGLWFGSRDRRLGTNREGKWPSGY
jgi:hypothetical protein